MDSVILLSGGIDSTVALADAVARGRRPLCMIWDYGQTLEREVGDARANAILYGCPFRVITFHMGWLAPQCAILQDGSRIEAHRTREQIAQAGTPSSYVPFRNGIMLSVAAAYAEGHGLHDIICGGNGLFSGNYWDDTDTFAAAMESAINEGTDPKWHARILFPNAGMPKDAVVTRGLELGVDFRRTWSCYHSARFHCGVCDSCVQRAAAFAANGLNIEGERL